MLTREVRGLVDEKYQDDIDVVTHAFGAAVYGWAKSTLLCALITGVASWLCFLILGIPYSVVLGFLCGILYFVPYIGPMVSCAIVAIIALFVSPLVCLISIVVNMVINNVIGNIIYTAQTLSNGTWRVVGVSFVQDIITDSLREIAQLLGAAAIAIVAATLAVSVLFSNVWR